jgi:transcriptional regulator GlxA family with amidase domain
MPAAANRPICVDVLAIPDATVSTITGIYEVFNLFGILGTVDDAVPQESPFAVQVVGAGGDFIRTASGLRLETAGSIHDVAHSDIVIVPSMLVPHAEWTPGRYPDVVTWLRTMHAGGALLCSACSGVLLLAETALLNGLEATLHWAYAPTLRRNFPRVTPRLEEVLIVTGARKELVMSGGSASWHDLVLYLIARTVGPTAALAISKFMLLQWHREGQGPYVAFAPLTDHGDAAVLRVQEWLRTRFSTPSPIEAMVAESGLPARTFKRRFRKATGHTPIEYVQQLRVAEAKRRLERTDIPVDDICWAVGYEDSAFFRRLFKRLTTLPPGDYRKKFRLPEYSQR